MSQFDTTIKPILQQVSKLLQTVVKTQGVEQTLSEDSLCNAFIQACAIINAPKSPITPPPAQEKVFPKNSPCCWEGCDKKVAKVERVIRNGVYCTRHYKLMCKKYNINPESDKEDDIKQPEPEPEPSTTPRIVSETIAEKHVETSLEASSGTHEFDFVTHPPVDFMSNKNLQWWSLVHYEHGTAKYLIHSQTGCIFNCDIQSDDVLVGWLDPSVNRIIATHKIPQHVMQWLKKSNIPNLPRQHQSNK